MKKLIDSQTNTVPMMIKKSFPKIFQLGDRHVLNIFDGIVEVTEKVDGSQFGFGKVNSELYCRSKGRIITPEAPGNLFGPVVSYIQSISHRIPRDTAWWGEYLYRPKHNLIKYGRIPQNFIALFGGYNIRKGHMFNYEQLCAWACDFKIDVVPLIFYGTIDSKVSHVEQLREWLKIDSFLGNTTIEGVVIKNYREIMVADMVLPVQCAKFVSEKFKERMVRRGKSEKATLPDFFESFRTEARWLKAIQHLRDEGVLVGEPKDIGAIIPEIKKDFYEECRETIMHYLYNHFAPQMQRTIIKGFPEWYKEYLVKNAQENAMLYTGEEENHEKDSSEN